MSDRDFNQWERACEAYAPVQRKRDGSLRGYCPACGHGPRVLKVSPSNGKVLAYCFRGCSFRQIISCLFEDGGTGSVPAKKHKPLIDIEIPSGSRIVPGSVRRYGLKDRTGRLIVTKAIGRDFDGKKIPWYEHPDGRASHSLDELDAHDLPFFNTELVDQYPAAAIILVEGEKSAKALSTILPHERFIALGTGSAGMMPNRAVLDVLFGREVFLWPDNDPYNEKSGKWAGQQHMADIADWLEMELEPRPRLINPDLLGPKEDAADFVAGGGTFARLEEMMLAYIPPSMLPMWMDGTMLSGNAPMIDESDDTIRARFETLTNENDDDAERFGWAKRDGWDESDRTATQIGVIRLPSAGATDTTILSGKKSSSPLFHRGVVKKKAGIPVSLANFARPERIGAIVPGLVYENRANLLYSDGGVGKSTLAAALAIHVALEMPFCGMRLKGGPVLYLDSELEINDFKLRVARILEGLRLPVGHLPGVTYMSLGEESLTDEGMQARIRETIEKERPILTIIDSWLFATNVDPLGPKEQVSAFRILKPMGTVLILDHERAPKPGETNADARPYGSTYKFNSARSTVRITSPNSNSGALILRQKKNNQGKLRDDLLIKVNYRGDPEEGPISFEAGDPTDPIFTPPQPVERETKDDVAVKILAAHPGGCSKGEVAREMDISETYAGNILSRLASRRLAKRIGKGNYAINEEE